jgi:hypothetical protein
VGSIPNFSFHITYKLGTENTQMLCAKLTAITILLLHVTFGGSTLAEGNRGSSVSIVSDYGLDDRVSIPGRRGYFL